MPSRKRLFASICKKLNVFVIDNSIKSFFSANPPPLERLIANPKTMRDRNTNSKILKELNKHHDDDFFQTGNVSDKMLNA